ncbi:MAG: molecular chaperone HtpG [Kiritimatiellaeota bacterium]|nr:molecular chaperone HtpG [Kiritimatiellota bacterium]
MPAKKRKFKTEVQQLLDLVVHSLYTNRDIFLRELISNASDAIDRARFEALSNPDVLEDDPEWKVRISVDRDARTLVVSDNGIGMAPDEIDETIGTIASSGTRRFLEELQKNEGNLSPELIGQFGVGFYSSFMVADKVTVLTRRAGTDKSAGVKWESAGTGNYTVEECVKETRGTDVVLHLKEGMDEYLEEWRIRKIVKTYSDFVEHPIVLAKEGGKEGGKEGEEAAEEVLNSQKAIWTRSRGDVTEDEYNEFYKHLSHDFLDPLEAIHWRMEGVTEFSALLFLPRKAMSDLLAPDARRHGIHLYVRKVFITDNAEALTPRWLRFLQGVVESADLPLNISRETLQDNRLIQVIRNNLVKKVLDTLSDMKEKHRAKYEDFWREFGRVLKEGIHFDLANRDKLKELVLFESSKTEAGGLVSLAEYVERMPDTQNAIYYITGENRQAVENSPHLEAFRGRDLEVLFLTDPIDEWVVQGLPDYRDKPLKDIARGQIDLPKDDDPAEPPPEDGDFKPLLEAVKKILGDSVREVRLSRRLTESACCLVSDEHDLGVQMEKILKAFQRELPPSKRILELNPNHPAVGAMRDLAVRDPEHPTLREYAELLYDQARLTVGLPIDDPLRFSRRISALMAACVKTAESTPDTEA